jgi:hypothetical protein
LQLSKPSVHDLKDRLEQWELHVDHMAACNHGKCASALNLCPANQTDSQEELL